MLTKKFAKGFSLIELLVVVVIIGILLMVGVPAYNQYILKARMVDFFVLADSHKIKLLEKIFNHSAVNSSSDNYVINNPSKLVTKLEHLINYQDKQYSIKMTANMLNLGLKPFENQPLIVEFLANAEDPSGLITWNCNYNKGYQDIMPKDCIEIVG